MKLVQRNKIIKRIINILLFFNKSLRKKIRTELDAELIKNIHSDITSKYPNDFIIFSRNGVGDIYFVASLLKEFKQKHKNRKIIYLTDKPKLVKFISSFKAADIIIADTDFKILQAISPLQKKIEPGKINYLFFPYRGTKKNFVFADSYTNLLDLDLQANRTAPVITNENFENANLEFKKLNCNPNRTIILIPEAVMFDYRVLSSKFWISLANKLLSEGFDVVFNSNNKVFKKYSSTFLEMTDFLAFCQQVKHIVSFRSGICDVLAGVGINNLTAIYPPNLEVIWANKFVFDNLLNKYHEQTGLTEFENIFNIYSLNCNFHRNNINEIIYENNENKLITKILAIIKGNKIDTNKEVIYN